MPYELPTLPYDYDALEPTIDEQTMRDPSWEAPSGVRRQPEQGRRRNRVGRQADRNSARALLEVIPEDKREAVRNNGGGSNTYWN